MLRPPVEYQRVKIQDESLRQFERFMQLRHDLADGNLRNIDLASTHWLGTQLALGDEYSDNSTFTKVGWTPNTIGDTAESGEDNEITIVGTRLSLNELGTGGLLGPIYLYREK